MKLCHPLALEAGPKINSRSSNLFTKVGRYLKPLLLRR